MQKKKKKQSLIKTNFRRGKSFFNNHSLTCNAHAICFKGFFLKAIFTRGANNCGAPLYKMKRFWNIITVKNKFIVTICAIYEDDDGYRTSLLDGKLHSCSNWANRVDSLALVLALVTRRHLRNTKCAGGQDHMKCINLERTAWDFRRKIEFLVALMFYYFHSFS